MRASGYSAGNCQIRYRRKVRQAHGALITQGFIDLSECDTSFDGYGPFFRV